MTISTGKEVSIEYTLKLDDKSVVDSNVGGEPLTYVQGSQQIIPGLEDALVGMKIGDSKAVTLKPEEGYGIVSKEAFVEVQKEQIPQDGLKVDARLQGTDTNGQPIVGRVAEIKEETVVLDFNHPLAGKTLHFDVKILNIQDGAAN
ncbi:MAG: peptidylprolyl isomerase [Thermodesulfobacteriota bacterium]